MCRPWFLLTCSLWLWRLERKEGVWRALRSRGGTSSFIWHCRELSNCGVATTVGVCVWRSDFMEALIWVHTRCTWVYVFHIQVHTLFWYPKEGMMQDSAQFVQLAQTLCYDLARAEKATDGKNIAQQCRIKRVRTFAGYRWFWRNPPTSGRIHPAVTFFSYSLHWTTDSIHVVGIDGGTTWLMIDKAHVSGLWERCTRFTFVHGSSVLPLFVLHVVLHCIPRQGACCWFNDSFI